MIKDTIYRQAAINAICAVCGNDCDKSEFVYNAPQDEQVILCPEHYCLCTLPCAQPEQKTGRWIAIDSYTAFGGDKATWMAHGNPIAYHYCSECKNHAYALEDGEDLLSDFCPNCGAKMENDL